MLPAFETPKETGLKEGRALVEALVDPPQGGKAGLAPLIASGKLQGFASVAYSKGHVCTDYNQWCAREVCSARQFIKGHYIQL